MQYHKCPNCGANLDCGERCDCTKVRFNEIIDLLEASTVRIKRTAAEIQLTDYELCILRHSASDYFETINALDNMARLRRKDETKN